MYILQNFYDCTTTRISVRLPKYNYKYNCKNLYFKKDSYLEQILNLILTDIDQYIYLLSYQ